LRSKLDPGSETFQTNSEATEAELENLQKALEASREGGGEKYVTRHHDRGKLLARERIELLLDRDSYFLELCPIAGHGVSGETSGTAVIGGIGLVSGVECLITASESTKKGGAITPMTVTKSARLSEISEVNRLPHISLVESAGADLPNQHKIFVPGGQGFRDLTRRSKMRIPSICLVFGSSTAGGAYMPGMSDYSVFVKDQAAVYLAGPPLVKMATGEVTDHESLGGASMHSSVSGVSDYLAEDERDAIRIGREIVAHLNWKKAESAPSAGSLPPRYPTEQLRGVPSADIRMPFDAREVIARIVDDSRFSEFKAGYGTTLVCGWARVFGYPVGILANNGILFSEAANKGAQFIELCNRRDIPLLFLQNITGFMVGEKYEREGIIKNGAKLINAVSNSTVPAITIMTGASYGAGNYAMCGRAFDSRFIFTWPNHQIGIMGGEQAAKTLVEVKERQLRKNNKKINKKEMKEIYDNTLAGFNEQMTAYYSTSQIWDDGIIDPVDTRSCLGIALTVISKSKFNDFGYGVMRF